MGTAAATGLFQIVPRHVIGGPGQTPPSEKLHIAGIGIGGMGAGNLRAWLGRVVTSLARSTWRSDDRRLRRELQVEPLIICLVQPAPGGTPATGGQVRRLTYHSGADTPCSFTPDGKHVLFTATRLDGVKHAEFPHYRALPELYRVPVDGGRPGQVLTIPAMEARYDRKGGFVMGRSRIERTLTVNTAKTFAQLLKMMSLSAGSVSQLFWASSCSSCPGDQPA